MTALEDLTDNEIAVTLEHLRADVGRLRADIGWLEAEQARRQPIPMTENKLTEIRNALAEYEAAREYFVSPYPVDTYDPVFQKHDKTLDDMRDNVSDYLRALLAVCEAATALDKSRLNYLVSYFQGWDDMERFLEVLKALE